MLRESHPWFICFKDIRTSSDTFSWGKPSSRSICYSLFHLCPVVYVSLNASHMFLPFYSIRLETKVWKEESICRKRGIIVYFADNRIQTMFDKCQGPCSSIQLRCLLFVSTMAMGSLYFAHFQFQRLNIFFIFLIYLLINWISTAYIILNSLCLITDYTGAVPEPIHLCGLNKSLNHSPAAQGRNCGDRFWFCRMLVDL